MPAAKDTLNLVVIGPKHAGKTVYMTVLANSPGVSLSDPATIEVISLHWKTLQDGGTPPATAGSIANLAFTFQCDSGEQSYNIDFTMPDYDGHFAETLSKYEDNTDIGKLRDVISEADGFIVFMPVGEEDVKTMEELRHEIGSFINILRKIYDEEAKVPAPLIIAVNKWDKSPSFKSQDEDKAALAYIESNEIYKLIYERLKSYFANVSVLPVSSYGHKTQDANPVPGACAPYRVTEPVRIVVEAFFSNLARHVEKEKADNDSAALAKLLIVTEPLWKRWPGCNYSELLRGSLQSCYDKLATALSGATKRSEFDEIWNKSPESAFVSYFTPAQQLELDHLREPLVAAEKKHRLKIGGLAASMVVAAAAIWYLVNFYGKFDAAWLRASTAETQNEFASLNEFLQEYEGSNLARIFGSAKLETARARLQGFVDNTRHDIEGRLAEIDAIADSCKRHDEAAQLVDLAERLPDSIPAQSMNRLNSVFKNSQEICSAKARIESAATSEQLDEARNLLASKHATEEVLSLREKLEAKNNALLAEAQAQAEKERIAPIREEYDGLLRDEDLAAAQLFIKQHEHDDNPEVMAMLANVHEKLPAFFYDEIMKKIAGLNDLKGDDFGNLQGFVAANNGYIDLDNQQRANIQRAMQDKVERLDSDQINRIHDHIETLQALENARDQLQRCLKTDLYNLDGGLFTYRRPDALISVLMNKRNRIDSYLTNLQHGVLSQWAVIAAEKNAISLDCDNFIPLDALLSISFLASGMPDQDYNNTLSCRRLDGGNGYAFFYKGNVSIYNGGIQLMKVRRMLSPLKCASHLNITPDDIITLSNGRPINFNLQNNCPGISIQFSR